LPSALGSLFDLAPTSELSIAGSDFLKLRPRPLNLPIARRGELTHPTFHRQAAPQQDTRCGGWRTEIAFSGK